MSKKIQIPLLIALAIAAMACFAKAAKADDAAVIAKGFELGAQMHAPQACPPSAMQYDRNDSRLPRKNLLGAAWLQGAQCSVTIKSTIAEDWELCSVAAHEYTHWNWVGGDLDHGLHESDPASYMNPIGAPLASCVAAYPPACLKTRAAKKQIAKITGHMPALWESHSINGCIRTITLRTKLKRKVTVTRRSAHGAYNIRWI